MQNQGISLANQPRAGIHPARSRLSWTAPSWQIEYIRSTRDRTANVPANGLSTAARAGNRPHCDFVWATSARRWLIVPATRAARHRRNQQRCIQMFPQERRRMSISLRSSSGKQQWANRSVPTIIRRPWNCTSSSRHIRKWSALRVWVCADKFEGKFTGGYD